MFISFEFWRWIDWNEFHGSLRKRQFLTPFFKARNNLRALDIERLNFFTCANCCCTFSPIFENNTECICEESCVLISLSSHASLQSKLKPLNHVFTESTEKTNKNSQDRHTFVFGVSKNYQILDDKLVCYIHVIRFKTKQKNRKKELILMNFSNSFASRWKWISNGIKTEISENLRHTVHIRR